MKKSPVRVTMFGAIDCTDKLASATTSARGRKRCQKQGGEPSTGNRCSVTSRDGAYLRQKSDKPIPERLHEVVSDRVLPSFILVVE